MIVAMETLALEAALMMIVLEMNGTLGVISRGGRRGPVVPLRVLWAILFCWALALLGVVLALF
jgi:hypothetical protein